MQVSARVKNTQGKHDVELSSGDRSHSISIPPKAEGFGSSATGGELLFLALATCYCNDLYREANKRGIELTEVEVQVDGEFGGEGDPAKNITFRAQLKGDASDAEMLDLMKHTDSVAEIQNTLRQSVPVTLLTE